MVRSWGLIVGVLVTTGCGSGESSSEPIRGGGAAQAGAKPAASGGVLVSGGGAAQAGAKPAASGGVLVSGGGAAQSGAKPATSGGVLVSGGGAAQAGAKPAASGGVLVSGGGAATRGGYSGLEGGNIGGGGSSSSGGSGVSASGGQTSGGSGTGGLPACVARDDPAAPYVRVTWTSEQAQPPQGGVLESGTYFLTSFAYHGGSYEEGYCLLALRHEVLRIDAASVTEGTLHTTEGSVFEDGSGRLQYKQEVAYATEGTSLTGRYTCWEPHTYVESYTATPNQIRFNRGPFNPTNCHKGVTLVLTYDKQP